MTSEKPFAGLSPDVVLDAVASLGRAVDGRLFALNSYENRVYQVGTADGPLVVKFYRPDRWSDAAILEEHAFTAELAAAEIAVAAPLRFAGGSLHRFAGFRFSAFPFMAGRAPELDAPEALVLLGRTLGRIHAIGRLARFRERPTLSVERFGWAARRAVLESGLVPPPIDARYAEASKRLLDIVEAQFAALPDVAVIRIHGDCHLGNVLWRPTGPLFVDLDDCMNGPRIQDLWMFLAGSSDEQQRRWAELMEGYLQFSDFDSRELGLIEPLRALRMVHHAAWLAARWQDPAFPRAFGWFGEPRFWERHVADLAEQVELIADPPLSRSSGR